MGQVGPKIKFFFGHFLKFASLVFLEIAYDDSLQQCLKSSRDKIHEKNFWGPKLGLSPFSQVRIISFPFKCTG